MYPGQPKAPFAAKDSESPEQKKARDGRGREEGDDALSQGFT
jgi:hypothetical protein